MRADRNQQMADVFTANPDLDAFILEGGWAQFAPQAYAATTSHGQAEVRGADPGRRRHAAAQIEALKAGRSHAQVGQRPFEMGYRAPA